MGSPLPVKRTSGHR
jgi:hypothetical protein